MNDSTPTPIRQGGFALVAVLMVMAIFFVIVTALMFQSSTERVVAANEQDYTIALSHVEAGLAWAKRRIKDTTSFSTLLTGPNAGSSADDFLLGLRDLSLTATTQFTHANEATASAIVQRDFGEGLKTYEVIRVGHGDNTRGLIYVRADDNYDDDPANPNNNDPLADKDQLIKVTVVAEYPVFVDVLGVEMASTGNERARGERKVVAIFGQDGQKPAAISSNGDVDIPSDLKLCGECGSIHTNQNLSIGGSPTICKDATASGSVSGGGTIGGTKSGGMPVLPVPIINPYEELFVPTVDTFDTASDTSLPAGLRCPKATPGDPGSSKYFAFVANNDKGLVYKAYWDFINARWTWRMIDNLASGNTKLDDCGRVSGVDPSFGYGSSGQIDDTKDDEFYGFKAASTIQWESCSGTDTTLSVLGNNNFNPSGFYATGGGLTAGVILPGSFSADTNPDFITNNRIKDGIWDYGSDTIYSPLYGAVIWVYGGVKLAGNPGKSGSIDFQCSGGAGCSSSSLPNGLWRVSFITNGDIEISGQANVGPANPDQDYHYLLMSGRDIKINGNPQEDSPACGSGCSTTSPSNISGMAGIIAAHEQIGISGNPNIFGFMVAEDSIDCSPMVDGGSGGVSTLGGSPNIFYDCNHPPNPWASANITERLWWQEVVPPPLVGMTADEEEED